MFVVGTSITSAILSHGYVSLMQQLCMNLLTLATASQIVLLFTNVRVFVGLSLALVPIALIELWLLFNYGATLNTHSLTVMISTDRHEALTYLIPQVMAWYPAIAVLGVTLIISICQLTAEPIGSLTPLSRRILSQTCACSLATIGILLWLWRPADVRPFKIDVLDPTIRHLERAWPVGVPIRFFSLYLERARTREFQRVSAGFTFNTETPVRNRIVVLVIGESSRASNWQLAGYLRNNTPMLNKRKVIWMKNYASNGVATSVSVPLMMTDVKHVDSEQAPKSILTAFREAGYETYWISNQATAGMHDLKIATYAQEAKHVTFANLGNHEQRGLHDEALLPHFYRALAGPGNKLIVVHLMGSHHPYANRYPLEDAKFLPDQQPEHWNNAYDNSIVQTDRVLANMIDALIASHRPGALVYASDHGELLRSTECSKQWHGFPAHENVFASALVWLAPTPEMHSESIAVIRNSVLATQGLDLFDTLWHLGSIQPERSQHAWSSSEYKPRQRLVNTFSGIIDADTPVHGACGVYSLIN